MSISPVHEVKLSGLVYGGDAIGRLPDGRAVFVPFALPGETVRLRILEDKPHHAFGMVEEILSPADYRIHPRCRHFGACGGCHYQHMSCDSQLEVKTTILVDQLKRIGKLEQIPIRSMVPSPENWSYRNFVQFGLTPDGKLGYSKARSNEIIPIEECYLPQALIDKSWPLLDFGSGTGIQRVGLRLGEEQDLQIILESKSDLIPEFVIEGLPASVVHVSEAGSVVLAGSDYTWMKVNGRLFRVSAGSFFQVNIPMAEKMVGSILSSLPAIEGMTILELYCGVGLFSAFLASKAARLVGIEASNSACDDFTYNLDEFNNVDLYEAHAEDAISYLDVNPDLVLVDPPRSGLPRKVLHCILGMKPPKMIYISCDPATLARDARYLVDGGYELSQVTPFDLFPHTYHIESISIWELKL